jgi:hypothetical protein
VTSKKRSIGLSLEDGRVLSSREQGLTDFHHIRWFVIERGVHQLRVVLQEMKRHCATGVVAAVWGRFGAG